MMKIFTLLLALIYLQGCATIKVIDLARGIKSTNYKIEDAWIDNQENEYNICISDVTGLHHDNDGKYALKIPVVIQGNEDQKLISYEHRKVLELSKNHYWWSYTNFDDREDVKVYDLDVIVKDKCKQRYEYSENIKTFKAFENIDFIDAMLFKGESIREELKNNNKFLVYIPNSRYMPQDSPDVSNSDFYICEISSNEPCLYIVAAPNIYDRSSYHLDKEQAKIYSIKQLVWESDKNLMWYLVIPFSLTLDLMIGSIILIGIGLAGGGAPGAR